jgi:hypothetical protein
MRIARWITALVASLLLLLGTAGVAMAGHPGMTYDSHHPEMTYD